MAAPKIVVDTNVVVAASILQNVSELNTQIKHEFYDQSIQLFSLFKTRPQEKIGIAIPKVKKESFGVLVRAVKDVFVPNGLTDVKRKELFYNDAVGIINSSEHKMRRLFALLSNVKLDENNIKKHAQDVKDMAIHLKKLWVKQYGNKNWKIRETQTRARPIVTEPKWREEQKEEVVYAHSGQVKLESRQLQRFMRKYPNIPDQRVLSEVLAVKEALSKNGDYFFLVASCDSGFFSPYISNNGISDTVTKEIYNRFKVRCDYPRQIFQLSGGRI